MRFRWLFVLILGVAVAKPAMAQLSAYGEFTASKLTGGLGTVTTTVLPGGTIGLTAQIAGKKHLRFYGDVRTGFYGRKAKLDEAGLGPKLGLDFKRVEAYTELIVGFGRYNDGLGNASTDAQTELNFGLDVRCKGRVDWRLIEYGYQQYYGLGGEYNPKSFSTGLVVHLGAR